MSDPTPGVNKISPVIQSTLENLTPLLGIWKGQGRGGYPTLEGFDYTEILHVSRENNAPILTYEQSTELVDPQGNPIRKSHWEAGVLRPLQDGQIELACVQGSGRVEVLRGHFIEGSLPEMLSLRFESVLVGNDERVKNSSREWFLMGDHFRYLMKMETSDVEVLTLHLESMLYREGR